MDFRNILNTLGSPVYITDKNHQVVWYNAACSEILKPVSGEKYESLIGIWGADIYNSHLKSRYTECLEGHKTGVVIPPTEVSWRIKLFLTPHIEDGKVSFVVTRGERIFDCTKCEDLTGIKSVYASVFENGLDVVWLLGLDLKMLYLSPSTERLFGYSLREREELGIEQLFTAETIHRIRKLIADTREIYEKTGRNESRIVEVEGRHKDGHLIHLEVAARFFIDDSGKIIGIQGSSRDITDRKKAETKLRESEEKFKAAFYTSPDAVNINKLDGEYVEINSGFTKLMGYTEEDVIGKKSTELNIWARAEDRKAFVKELTASGIVESMEFLFKAKDGSLIPALMSATIITLNDTDCILSVTKQIADRKRMEEKLIEAKEKAEESNRLKTEFLNNMSHEIRTPMNGIMGFSRMLQNPDLSSEKRRYYSQLVQNSSTQLLKIIEDILEISDLEACQITTKKEKVCLNDLLMQLFADFDQLAKEKNLRFYLQKSLDDRQSTIYTDRVKLKSALEKLVDNAMKYTFEGSIELGYHRHGDKMDIYVKDTGLGICDDSLHRIFERFTRENRLLHKQQGGLGLGLSIARENAKLLQGDIRIESCEDKGSTFTLEIPFHAVYKAEEHSGSQKEELYILVAEDEEVNFLYIEEVLTQATQLNCRVNQAKNGYEAVEFVASGEKPDLILMDVKMPKMDGFQALMEIKRINPHIPVVAQTAYSSADDQKRVRDAGFDGYISKPIKKETIIDLVNNLSRTNSYFDENEI